ncbi:MAG TPA: PqqD family protein [Pseudobdellovibrionaceae bacterium]|nr:PqqD family protein [Pseudobdellovibrionaceae bacterium]
MDTKTQNEQSAHENCHSTSGNSSENLSRAQNVADSFKASWRIAEGLAWNRIGDEILILDSRGDLESRSFHSLNSTAAQLWESLEQGVSYDELLAQLRRFAPTSMNPEFEEQLHVDLKAFLSSLHEKRLIEM